MIGLPLLLSAVVAFSSGSAPTLSELVHHGGQYHGPRVFRSDDPLAKVAYRVGRHKAPHAAIRVFVKVASDYGEAYLLVGVQDEATRCVYAIQVYAAIRRRTWNIIPMVKLCPVGDAA